MFSLFRKPLIEHSPPEIGIVYLSMATRQFNMKVAKEAGDLGQPTLFSDFSKGLYWPMMELFYAMFCGRSIARIESKIGTKNPVKPIPKAPLLLTQPYDIKNTILVILSSPRYSTSLNTPLCTHALSISAVYQSGLAIMFEENFTLWLGEILNKAGFGKEASSRMACDTLLHLDQTITDTCQQAQDYWQTVPTNERALTLEQFAGTLGEQISVINGDHNFEPLLTPRKWFL